MPAFGHKKSPLKAGLQRRMAVVGRMRAELRLGRSHLRDLPPLRVGYRAIALGTCWRAARRGQPEKRHHRATASGTASRVHWCDVAAMNPTSDSCWLNMSRLGGVSDRHDIVVKLWGNVGLEARNFKCSLSDEISSGNHVAHAENHRVPFEADRLKMTPLDPLADGAIAVPQLTHEHAHCTFRGQLCGSATLGTTRANPLGECASLKWPRSL